MRANHDFIKQAYGLQAPPKPEPTCAGCGAALRRDLRLWTCETRRCPGNLTWLLEDPVRFRRDPLWMVVLSWALGRLMGKGL